MKIKACTLTVAVLVAWALKRHYAGARADDLWWILAPTAELVGIITRVPFTWQPGEGYFSREQLFLIEKSCAGINFMIAAFAMLVFTVFHRVSGGLMAVHVLGVSVLASYTAAVSANAVRIAFAMWLTPRFVALTAVSPADIHRIEGIAVYFGGLMLLYDVAQRLDHHASIVGSSVGADGRHAEVAS